MFKWTGKDGLKAIFKDTAKMPWRMTRGYYQLPRLRDNFMNATAGVLLSHTLSMFAATFATAVSGGPSLTGMAAFAGTYCLFPTLIQPLLNGGDKDAGKIFYPHMSAHSEAYDQMKAEKRAAKAEKKAAAKAAKEARKAAKNAPTQTPS